MSRQKLIKALKKNSLSEVQKIINTCLDAAKLINDATAKESPSLFYCKSEEAQILLLENGANPNIRMSNWDTSAFFFHLHKCSLGLLNKYLEAGADIHHTEFHNEGVLVKAAENSLGVVQRLVEVGAKIDIGDISPLTWAKNIDIMQFLLDNGADINYAPTGWTALHQAGNGSYGRENSQVINRVKFLLDNGASPNILHYAARSTALHVAAQAAPTEMIRLLCKAGSDITIKDLIGRTPFQWTFPNNREAARLTILAYAIHSGTYSEENCPNASKEMLERATILSDLLFTRDMTFRQATALIDITPLAKTNKNGALYAEGSLFENLSDELKMKITSYVTSKPKNEKHNLSHVEKVYFNQVEKNWAAVEEVRKEKSAGHQL